MGLDDREQKAALQKDQASQPSLELSRIFGANQSHFISLSMLHCQPNLKSLVFFASKLIFTNSPVSHSLQFEFSMFQDKIEQLLT